MRNVARVIVLLTTALFAAAPSVRAQCTPLPGTGCPGTLPIMCSGSAQIGQRIAFDCPNDGRAFAQFLLVGVCEPGGAPIVPPFACVAGPCWLAIRLGSMVAIPNNFATVALTIPNDPSLIGQSLCVQCADLVARPPSACLILSEAGLVTFL